MVKRNHIKSSISLVFSRWSRKSFASFCSIGRNVIISKLKNEIADASITKKQNCDDCTTFSKDESIDTIDEYQNDNYQDILFLNFLPTNNISNSITTILPADNFFCREKSYGHKYAPIFFTISYDI